MLDVDRRPWRPLRSRGAKVVLAAVAASAAAAVTASQGAAASGPTNTARPAISGTPQAGQTLSATTGTWQGQGAIGYAYQWQRCDATGQACADISGATGATYVLTSADVGNTDRVVVTATDATGSSQAASDPSGVVQAAPSTAPASTAPPAITGAARTGSTLSASVGTWSGQPPLEYAYAWQRCDANGGSCTAIAAATQATYAPVSDDVGHALRVVVTARNASGSASATSVPTAVVQVGVPPSLVRLPGGGRSVSAIDVRPPQRLVIDRVRFDPSPLRSRRAFSGSFRVVDTRGYAVRGALVLAVGLPYGRVDLPDEATTDATGWARMTFHPTSRLPLIRGGSLVVFVRARVPGERLIAGVSTRRLVNLPVTAP